MPSSTPVTLPPTAPSTAPPGVSPRRSCILSSSGLSSSRKPATFARTQPGRSTTRTGVSCGGPSVPIRVKPRTCSSDALACRRSSATMALASSRLTSGPGRTSRVAVATARFQSTISAPPMLVMRQPYVSAAAGAGSDGGGTAVECGPRVVAGPLDGRAQPAAATSAAAAVRQGRRRGGPGPSGRPWRSAVLRGQEGEGQQAAVGVHDRAGEGVDAGQGARLGAYERLCRGAGRA